MKAKVRERLGRMRPDLLLGSQPPARALRTLADRRHVWECQVAEDIACTRCYRRCAMMPCVLLPVEAEAIMRSGLGQYLALRVVPTVGAPVNVLYVAPRGYEGSRMPIGIERLPCSMVCDYYVGHRSRCDLSEGTLQRPVASVIRACSNWKSHTGSGKFMKDYASKLDEAEKLYFGLAVLLWSRKYGKYVSTLWKETVLYGG